MKTNEIKQILIDQRKELEDILKDKRIIKREFLEDYQKLLKSSLIKIITGSRRAGKSVLSFQLLKNKNFGYLNFDDERLSTLETTDLNLVLRTIQEIYKKPEFIFFDEIQNIPKWELFVNRLKRQKINLVITGSNSNLLNTELASHLTGRHFSLELYPFSFREYLDFNNFNYRQKYFTTEDTALIRRFLEQYLFFGGFPEVVRGEDYKKYLLFLYSTILTKDILLRHRIKHINTLKDFARYLISNFSRKITFNKLKNIFSLKSVHTAQNYFLFIEESYLVFPFEKFSYKTKERLVAPRKIYSIDTGLINALTVKFSQEIGYIYENVVAIELLRKKVLNPEKEIYYWEGEYNQGVDFITKEGAKIRELIQVSYDIENYDTKKREINSLLKASRELKCNNLLIITSDTEAEEKIKGKKIKFVPLWKWLLKW